MPRSSENAGQSPATDSSSQPEVLNGKPSPIDRREFLVSTAAGAAALAWPRHGGRAERPGAVARRDDDLSAIRAEVKKRHVESVERLQHWIRQPSIAAEHRGLKQGCVLSMRFCRAA